jgi:sensor histidine kinase YesM
MKGIRSFGRIMAANVAAAAILPVFLVVFGREWTLLILLKQFFYGLVYSTCIGTPAWLVLSRIGRRIVCLPVVPRIASLVGVLCGLAIAGSFAANLIFLSLGWLPLTRFQTSLAFGLRISIAITLLLGSAITVYETLSHRLHAATLELRTRELAEERHRKLASEARLSSLESRIHPHFLFNTLNSISALIREDPAKAERTVERLAALLRYSLDSHGRGVVPLRQELRVVEDYLEIEKTRFGERLRFAIDVPRGLDDLEVPPLALQTLVENSIKHAVAASRQGGEVRIAARLDGASLRLEVTDDGPGFDIADIRQGHGLENLRERLAAIFDGAGRLELDRREGRMTVTVAVPQGKVLA